MEQRKYIAIDGPIGVGKTTLVKRLVEEWKGTPLLEPEARNPFLPEFYRDRKRLAFKTQLFFLVSRFQQQKDLEGREKISLPVVCDYTFAKDQIFAKINLNEDEKELYHQIYNLLGKQLQKPDLVVYLRAKASVLLKRIKNRGFDYEKPVTAGYLEDLMEGYNEYFLNYNETPLLVVDTTHTDFLTANEQYELLKKEILNHRAGTINLVLR